MHYRARAYDPQTARFLQEDPLWFEAGDLNVYRYVWNSPLNWTDPTGMSAIAEEAGAGGLSMATIRALTVNGVYRLLAVGRNGVIYLKNVVLKDKGLGCAFAVKFASIVNALNNDQADFAQDACSLISMASKGGAGRGGGGGKGKGGYRGERGRTGKPSGTGNEFKKMKPNPKNDKTVIYTDSDGKQKIKPKPPGFDDFWNS